MKKQLLLSLFFIGTLAGASAQNCAFDQQITTADSLLCLGDSTALDFTYNIPTPADTILTSPPVNNNGQDGNMFDITATNTVRIRYFEGNIANTPSTTTDYYIYYKVGTHVGFEGNSAAWTLIAGPVSFNPNAPNTYTTIPINVNIVIPAGQTYAFYLTNTSAISNNNRYHNGTATGNVLATNPDLTIYEGTGGAYPFGTFFNARPWEGIVHYDFPAPTYLWSTGGTSSSITVQPGATTDYSCAISFSWLSCFVQDTITVQVNNPVIALGNDTNICPSDTLILDAGNPGATYSWCTGPTTQVISATLAGNYCVTITDSMGCSASDTLSLTLHSLPSVDAGNDQEVCEGGTITLNGSGASSYVWDNGVSDGVAFAPAASGPYIVTGTDTNNCSASDTMQVVINSLPVVALGPDIVQGNPPAILDAGAGFASYFWSSTGSGTDTTQTFSANFSGGFFVTVTDSNGCTASDTIIVTFTTGLAGNDDITGTIRLYPNPAEDMIQLDIEQIETANLEISIYDLNGRILQVEQTGPVSGSFHRYYSVSALSPGVYILQLKTGNVSKQVRFIRK